MPEGGSAKVKNPLASGLGPGGRMAAWVVAIGAVAAYNYWDSERATSDSFAPEEQDAWNKKKKDGGKK